MRKFFSAFGGELTAKAGAGETATVSVLKSGGFKERALAFNKELSLEGFLWDDRVLRQLAGKVD